PDAFDVLKAWGLEYWFTITWVKTHFVLGRVLRHQAEFVVVGKRGAPHFVPQGDKSDVIIARPGAHSEKPDELYRLVEALFPEALKLDYFARRQRDGWDAFGTLEHNAGDHK
ncbi:MAG: MT-A70 family methyltransferase, partial [Desulfomonilaceae bacterium]